MAAEKKMRYVIEAEDRTKTAIESAERGLSSFNMKVSDMAKGVAVGELAAKGLEEAFNLLSEGARKVADFMKEGIEANKEQELIYVKLKNQLKDVSGNYGELVEKIKAYAEGQKALGFDDESTTSSMGRLIQKTGDYTTAVELNSLAMNVARFKNIDLASATDMVVDILAGKGQRALVDFGIQMKTNATQGEVLAQIYKVVGTSAEDQANTSIVNDEKIKIATEDLSKAFTGPLMEGITRAQVAFINAANDPSIISFLGKVGAAAGWVADKLTAVAVTVAKFAGSVADSKKARVNDLKSFISASGSDEIVTMVEDKGVDATTTMEKSIDDFLAKLKGGFGTIGGATDDTAKKIKSALGSLSDSIDATQKSIEDLVTSYGDQVEKNLEGHLDKIKDFNAQISQAVSDNNDSQAKKQKDYQANELGLYMSHQDKLTGLEDQSKTLREQMSAETDKAKRSDLEFQVEKIRGQIQAEQRILDAHGDLASKAADYRGQSDFDRLEQQYKDEQKADETALKKKMDGIYSQIDEENKAYEKQSLDLKLETEKRFNDIVEEYKKGYSKIIEAAQDNKISDTILEQMQSSAKTGLRNMTGSTESSMGLIAQATKSVGSEKVGNIFQFTFLGDFYDKDTLIRQVTDAVNRGTALAFSSKAK